MTNLHEFFPDSPLNAAALQQTFQLDFRKHLHLPWRQSLSSTMETISFIFTSPAPNDEYRMDERQKCWAGEKLLSLCLYMQHSRLSYRHPAWNITWHQSHSLQPAKAPIFRNITWHQSHSLQSAKAPIFRFDENLVFLYCHESRKYQIAYPISYQ